MWQCIIQSIRYTNQQHTRAAVLHRLTTTTSSSRRHVALNTWRVNLLCAQMQMQMQHKQMTDTGTLLDVRSAEQRVDACDNRIETG